MEINLMSEYPKTKRDLDERVLQRTKEDQIIARKFGEEFFDGDRSCGYGGYNYHPRFWTEVVKDMIDYYSLTNKSKILDVGCAKGFTLYDFTKSLPGIKVRGIDISEYAINNAKREIKSFVSIGDAKDLSRFKDKEFDLVISITTIHNLPLEECRQSLREIQRVGKNAFITVDAWKNDKERERMLKWNLTARTLMSTEDWKRLFKEENYTGDYYWFTP